MMAVRLAAMGKKKGKDYGGRGYIITDISRYQVAS